MVVVVVVAVVVVVVNAVVFFLSCGVVSECRGIGRAVVVVAAGSANSANTTSSASHRLFVMLYWVPSGMVVYSSCGTQAPHKDLASIVVTPSSGDSPCVESLGRRKRLLVGCVGQVVRLLRFTCEDTGPMELCHG